MPPTDWPKRAPEAKSEGARFVACGAFVRGKHFDILMRAFQQLCQTAVPAELHIYGLHHDPTDSICQNEIVAHAAGNSAIQLHQWSADWADDLTATDTFVHLGYPESFGMVILEAFARGCRLVVLPNTFLDDLPAPLNTTAVYRAEELSVDSVVKPMRTAMADHSAPGNIWELRRQASGLFSPEGTRPELAQIYESVLRR